MTEIHVQKIRNFFNLIRSDLDIIDEELYCKCYRENLNSEKLVITQLVQGKLKIENLLNHEAIFDEDFFQNNLFNLFIQNTSNSFELQTKADFDTKIENLQKEFNNDEEINFKLRHVQSIPLPFSTKIIINCYLDEQIFKMIESLLDTLTIDDCENLIEKIYIIGELELKFKSSLITIGKNDNKELISEYILNYINLCKEREKKISSIPNLISNDQYLSEDIKKKCMMDVLENLFDNKVNTSLFIYKQSAKHIQLITLPTDYMGCYNEISKVVRFVFDESNRYREKMIIVKNLLYDTMTEEKQRIDEVSFWDKLLIEVTNEYKLYVDDKLTKFISEKKEIIKEQFLMSKEIAGQIADSKKALMSNLIYIMSIFLSKFFIEAISGNNINYSYLAYNLALIFSVYLIAIYFLSGEYNSSKIYSNRVKIMNEYYPRLYLTKDNIIDELEERISTPEIKQLQIINLFSGFVYLIILVFCVYKAGYLHLVINYYLKFRSLI